MPTNTENILTSATIAGSNGFDLTFTVNTDGVLTISTSNYDTVTTISTGFYLTNDSPSAKDALLTLGRSLIEASNQL